LKQAAGTTKRQAHSLSDLAAIDLSILHWVNSYAHRSYLLDKSIVLLVNAAIFKGGFLFAFLWWLWFSKSGERRDNRVQVLRLCVGLTVALTLARALQILLPGQTRPIHEPSVAFVLPYLATSDVLEHWSSFPSDHAVIFFAVATAIWLRSRLWGAVACLWVLLFACLPRIYVGYHYPSDVLAGAAIGAGIMVVAHAVPLTSAGRRAVDRVLRWEQLYPSVFYSLAFLFTYQLVTLFDSVRTVGRAANRLLSTLSAWFDISGSEMALPLIVGGVMAVSALGLAIALWWLLARHRRVRQILKIGVRLTAVPQDQK